MLSTEKGEFVIRLLVPSVMMGAALWYLGSLWDARMREQNLIMILPVVVAMVPFYLWVVAFEIARYRSRTDAEPARPRPLNHIYFMALSAACVAAFYMLGAVPATLALTAGGMLVLGVRRPLLLVAVPPVVVFVLWLVFVQGFGIRMPLLFFP